jgi:hypothetical protein
MYKAVAIDMDGTLLNENYEISAENVRVLNELLKKGIKIFIVTGRMYQAVVKYFEVLGFKTTCACYNGAKIYDTNAKVIYKKEIEFSFLKSIANFNEILEKGITPLFFINDELYSVKYDENVVEYEERTGVKCKIDEKLFEKNFITTKTVFSTEKYELLDFLKNDLKKYGEKIYVTRSKKRYLEILDKNVNKGEAVKFLAEKNGLSLADFVVIGDNNNDEAMFLPEVYKIAMGNGEKELKEKADFVTKTNDENGVAFALKNIFGV